MYAEWVRELGGLPYPAKMGELDEKPSEATDYPAVQLFLERAWRVRSDYIPSAGDLPAIIRLCQLFDGAPLGLELAAAGLRVMPCSEIVHRSKRILISYLHHCVMCQCGIAVLETRLIILGICCLLRSGVYLVS